MKMTLREWIGGAAAAGLLQANPLGLPIGCQTYPVRNEIAQDFPGTLKTLRAAGMETIELCSPHSYREFSALAKMGTAEITRAIRAAGLKCESCHYGFRELKENLDERIAFAKGLGLKQMVLSTFGLPASATLADWKSSADKYNEIAQKIRSAGMAAGYHNHTNEFHQLDGVLIYDELLRRLDSKLIGLQFQTGVISLGYQAAPYFTKYPGRYLSIHVSDWSPAEKKQVAVGTGEIDWKKLFAAAKTGGVKNYFLEMALDPMKASVPYLRGLKV